MSVEVTGGVEGAKEMVEAAIAEVKAEYPALWEKAPHTAAVVEYAIATGVKRGFHFGYELGSKAATEMVGKLLSGL